VDEKAVGTGQDYLTVVSDLDAGTVEYLADERRQAGLDGYFTPGRRDRIRAVAMDMWQPYIDSVRAHLTNPDSKIVFDRCHLMRYLTTAVDTVRKREHRALAAAGDMRLARSKYLWLYSAENLPERHGERFAALRAVDLKTGRAWAIEESLRRLWNHQRRGRGERHRRRWYFWATHSRPHPRHRRGAYPQTPRSRRGEPQLPPPGHPGLRSRPPQQLQNHHLLPLRRATALATDPRNSG
jgi:transposase